METIHFLCDNCERSRDIEILKMNKFYVIGRCLFCKSKVTMNSKRLGSPRIKIIA
jgi:hypothetical protein